MTTQRCVHIQPLIDITCRCTCQALALQGGYTGCIQGVVRSEYIYIYTHTQFNVSVTHTVQPIGLNHSSQWIQRMLFLLNSSLGLGHIGWEQRMALPCQIPLAYRDNKIMQSHPQIHKTSLRQTRLITFYVYCNGQRVFNFVQFVF